MGSYKLMYALESGQCYSW